MLVLVKQMTHTPVDSLGWAAGMLESAESTAATPLPYSSIVHLSHPLDQGMAVTEWLQSESLHVRYLSFHKLLIANTLAIPARSSSRSSAKIVLGSKTNRNTAHCKNLAHEQLLIQKINGPSDDRPKNLL